MQGQGAVFADKNHTDLVNSIAAGNLLAGSGGLKVIVQGQGSTGVKYRLELDTKTRETVTGTGDGTAPSTIKIYEKEDWDALTEDPGFAIVGVFDKTTEPVKFGTYFMSALYIRDISNAPDLLTRSVLNGEPVGGWWDGTKGVAVTADPQIPTGTTVETALPQSITYMGLTYTISNVGDVGGGVLSYDYAKVTA